jgi:hypothetical protein
MTKTDMLTAIKNIIADFYPHLKSNAHLQHKAKVIKVNSTQGTPNLDGTGERFYSVDLQPMNLDGTENKRKPIIKDVPLDVAWIGANRGLFHLPKVGALVRVAYYEANLAYPYIDGVLSDNQPLPQVQDDELLIQHSTGKFLKFKANGDVVIDAPNVEVNAGEIKLGGTTEVARKNDTVDVQLLVTYGGFGAVTGVSVLSATINSGSSKVKAG